MKVPKLVIMLVGILIIGCMIFYVGCGETGNPQDPKNAGTSTGSNPTQSPSPNPTQTGASGEKVLATGGNVSSTYDLLVNAGYVYWTQKDLSTTKGGVFRTKINGTSTVPEAVAQGYPNAFSLTLGGGNNLFFTQKSGSPDGSIMKKDLGTTGTTAQTFVKGLTNPLWIRYNSDDGYLYFLETRTAGAMLKRVLASSTDGPDTIKVETVCDKFVNPYAMYVDVARGIIYVAGIAGSGTTDISWVTNKTLNQSANKLFSKSDETQSVTSITVDNGSPRRLYWANCYPNSGVFRIKLKDDGTSIDGLSEVVETGLAAAFDVFFGQTGGFLYYTLNVARANNGSIYSDDTTKIEVPSVNVLTTKTTANWPLRAVFTNGSYFWTEYPDFSTGDLDQGGGPTSRVMMYTPPTK